MYLDVYNKNGKISYVLIGFTSFINNIHTETGLEHFFMCENVNFQISKISADKARGTKLALKKAEILQ